MKKIAILLIAVMIGIFFLPMIPAEIYTEEPSPAFKIYLGSAIYFTMNNQIQIYVKNTGNAPAHNVTLTELKMSSNGLIVYNDRGADWHNNENIVLEPGDQISGHLATTVFGLGRFTANMNVTCSECINGTGTGNGIVIGFLVFIP